MRPTCLAIIVALCAGLTLVAQRSSAQSWGCMRLPSTTAQYLGYGYGPGRHAPLVRTPGQRPDPVPRRVVHPAAYGPLWPAGYQDVRCYEDCGQYGVGAPVVQMPAPALTPAMNPPMLAAPIQAPMYVPAPQAQLQLAPPMAQHMGPGAWQ